MIIDNKMACSERSRNAERGYESTDANKWLCNVGWENGAGRGLCLKISAPQKKWWTVKSKDMLDQTLVLSDLCIWKKKNIKHKMDASPWTYVPSSKVGDSISILGHCHQSILCGFVFLPILRIMDGSPYPLYHIDDIYIYWCYTHDIGGISYGISYGIPPISYGIPPIYCWWYTHDNTHHSTTISRWNPPVGTLKWLPHTIHCETLARWNYQDSKMEIR